ncbi:hypothetical protein PTKIN_Ptkin19aG0073900 [Pterospermum kingtungense]
MRAFIRAINEYAWDDVLTRKEHPTKMIEGKIKNKPRSKWTANEVRSANFNSKASNAIIGFVDPIQFNLISTCSIAFDVWQTLKIQYEGTNQEIVNDAFTLGKVYTDANLVQKVLRSLPDRFEVKVAAIEDAKDLKNLPLDELMGNLETFEGNLKRKKNENSLAFKADMSQPVVANLLDNGSFEERIVHLLENLLKHLNNKKNRSDDLNNDKKMKNKGIKCRECEGYRHIQVEYANTLRKKKSLNAT